MTKQRRGFALLSRERMKEVASSGGIKAHEIGKAHTYTPSEASRAGKKGGRVVSRDRKHMSEIGKKGAAARIAKRAAREADEQRSESCEW